MKNFTLDVTAYRGWVLYSLVLFGLFLVSSSFSQEKRDESEVVPIDRGDPEMEAAIRQAQATLDTFLQLAAKPPPNAFEFKLKVMVQEGRETEHFWVYPFRRISSGFEGSIANDPKIVRSVTAGQTIKFTRSEISDWGYVKDGRQVGNYTVCLLFKRMPKDQADYYRKNHGFDC